MSGICGLLRVDGEPVDRDVLMRMSGQLAFRGPDGSATWLEGSIGLGHSYLSTTLEVERSRQPLSLDGKVWIAADARIDGVPQLRTELAASGRRVVDSATDAELILHAYQAWGEHCLARLIGDFAFAIWDGTRQSLFCARDHFGVKPFFYSHVGPHVIFSNTLDCIRQHPAISNRLNDLAIADFLLFDGNQDPASTSFADIQRIPPGHQLVCSGGSLQLKRYWSIPTDLGVHYRDSRDYIAHFKHLLTQAVADRVRSDKVAVAMSGGLDSTAVASVARELLSPGAATDQVRAQCVVFDGLIPDFERRFASMAAAHMGIPIDFVAADRFHLYQGQRDDRVNFPEPWHNPCFALHLEAARLAASHSRVVLTGWDGDALLNESPKPYFNSLFKQRRFMPLLAGISRYAMAERRLPNGVLAALRGRKQVWPSPAIPSWMDESLVARLDLRARLAALTNPPRPSHPIRPYAYRTLAHLAASSGFFDIYDAAATRRALEYRHPLLDLRLVRFCLSLPPFPWCVRKEILRIATRGSLPDMVRSRPKTPLAGSPFPKLLQRKDASWVSSFTANASLSKYVDDAMIPRQALRLAGRDADQTWIDLRPVSLSIWLDGLSTSFSRKEHP
jgi:asparagine synthase (glutamine-hydrolysing)